MRIYNAKYYDLRYSQKTMRVVRRRQQEQTEAFKQKYRWQAGVEATMSQYDRLTGIKRLRVQGFKAVRYAAVMKATAVNLTWAVAANRAQIRPAESHLDPNSPCSSPFSIVEELIGNFIRLILNLADPIHTFRAYAYTRLVLNFYLLRASHY